MNLKLPPVNRFLALVACFVFCLGLLPNTAYAVTPQEGWYISGRKTIDDIEYYIIDNKVNDQKWWVDLNGGYVRLDEVYESGYSDVNGNLSGIMEGVQGFYYMREAYRGFTPDKDWRLDNDWLIEVSVSSASLSLTNANGTTLNPAIFGITFLAFDKSKLPTVSADYESLEGVIGRDFAFSIEQGVYNIIPAYGSTRFLGPSYQYSSASNDPYSPKYYPVSNFSTLGLFTGADYAGTILGEEGINSFDLDGCSINDLVIFPSGTAIDSALSFDLNVRCFFRFLCPVDKAPSGMSVGDRWPKVWPLEIEFEEAYKEYYDRMLAIGQISDPEDVDLSFGQLDSWKDTMQIGLSNMPEDGLTFAGLTMGMLGSSLGSWLVWIFLGCLLLVFINKAVH